MQKTAIVTGAARGIGKAIAKRLVEDGFFVAAVYNSSEKLAKELESELYPNVKAYKCDVSDSESVNAVVKAVLKDRKTVDVLVNNAGIAQQKLFTDITDEDWSRMIGVDLSGAFYFTRAVLPSMINEKSGRIINITSMGRNGRLMRGTLFGSEGRAYRNDEGTRKGNGTFGDLRECGLSGSYRNRYDVKLFRSGQGSVERRNTAFKARKRGGRRKCRRFFMFGKGKLYNGTGYFR